MKQMIKKMAVVLSVALVCAPMGAMAANKLIIKDATGVNDKLVVDDRGLIGIGNSTPQYPIHILANDPVYGVLVFHMLGRTAALPSDSNGISLFRNNIPSVNGGLPRNADRLGFYAFGTSTAQQSNTGYAWTSGFQSYAEGDYTPTSMPTYLTIETTSVNSNSLSEKVRVTGAGNVGIGTKVPTQKLDVNGAIRFNTTGAQPACDASNLGTFWIISGATDVLQLCANVANVPTWRSVTLQ